VKASTKKIPSDGSIADKLARGDQALLSYHFADALSQYGEILEGASSSTALIQYRVGLCHESLGHSEKAIPCYRSAITTSTSPSLTFASRLAIARCLLLTNNTVEARQALYPVLLNEAKQLGTPDLFLSEARYLVALALARETHPATTDRLGLDRLASFTEVALDVPFYLDETAKTPSSVKKIAVDVPAAPIVIQKRTSEKPALALQVQQAGQSSKELIDKVTSDAGWRVDWTPAAKKFAVERLLDIHVHNWTLLELLEMMADHLDLACHLDGEIVRFSTRAELNGPKAAQLKCEMAQWALEAAIRADASHPLTAAATIELGNWHAHAGKIPEAIQWYERLIREEPASPCVILAFYNRAQLHLRKQSFLQARRDFYRAIDQSPGHEFALRAQLRLGQLAFEEEDAKEAIPLFRRAQTLAPGSVHQPLAALNLAAAWLMVGKPEQARGALQKQRVALRQAPYKDTAAFLDGYATHQLAVAAKLLRREGSDLLSTLLQNQDTTLLGPIGQTLIAQAYDDLGFPDQAERLLRKALANVHTKTSLATNLELKLAEALLKQDQRSKAQPLLEKVAATSFNHRTLANFHLARLDLLDKEWKLCADKCRHLWEEKSFADSAALLQMWGTAYEGMGDYTRAAQCFSGKAPQ
jgi:tetratricopeptide (TPR) repeat protein